MNKLALLFALLGAAGLAHGEERCWWKAVQVPVVEVNDMHQQMDLPEMAGTCVNGKCESHVVSIQHFETEPDFEVVVMYRGETLSFRSPVEPTGSTVRVNVQQCGKKRTPQSVKPST